MYLSLILLLFQRVHSSCELGNNVIIKCSRWRFVSSREESTRSVMIVNIVTIRWTVAAQVKIASNLSTSDMYTMGMLEDTLLRICMFMSPTEASYLDAAINTRGIIRKSYMAYVERLLTYKYSSKRCLQLLGSVNVVLRPAQRATEEEVEEWNTKTNKQIAKTL